MRTHPKSLSLPGLTAIFLFVRGALPGAAGPVQPTPASTNVADKASPAPGDQTTTGNLTNSTVKLAPMIVTGDLDTVPDQIAPSLDPATYTVGANQLHTLPQGGKHPS